ncbi:YqiA/YcfP family alpha/beta fold hydrolase [Marinomonas sp. FW-1]|uniref:YqiA/YcfP family alpha/beta fold hydrolase n=1 Tax=Marinomonas sp. FW-1 TaxID=2071621 RepID=UPI0010C13AB7|nr:YqiA/YcfP family alpha/beta fold hydrolase [Marinomonas sp. FW-1]
MTVLLYIHGFNSSERSHKATVLSEAAKKFGVSDAVVSPRLSWQPAQAIKQLADIIEANQAQDITLIGSSLGGFYAAYLAEKYHLKAILVNPAVQAPILLQDYLGPQSNPYTGEEYELTQAHMAELEELVVTDPTAEYYWLMIQEGDEVLDYREALKAFPQTARLTHEENGNHSFTEFERFSEDILRFAEILTE